MIMLGGTQLFLGPLVGALLLQLLNHFVTVYTEYHGLVLGSVILLIVLGLRQGVADYVMGWWQDRRARQALVPVPADEVPKQERV